jgi:hypothetical protein
MHTQSDTTVTQRLRSWQQLYGVKLSIVWPTKRLG